MMGLTTSEIIVGIVGGILLSLVGAVGFVYTLGARAYRHYQAREYQPPSLYVSLTPERLRDLHTRADEARYQQGDEEL